MISEKILLTSLIVLVLSVMLISFRKYDVVSYAEKLISVSITLASMITAVITALISIWI